MFEMTEVIIFECLVDIFGINGAVWFLLCISTIIAVIILFHLYRKGNN